MYFFFFIIAFLLYINVATICEWYEQMLGIPVLCRGLKLPSYPCHFMRDFKDFSYVQVNSWTGLIIFSCLFLNENYAVDWLWISLCEIKAKVVLWNTVLHISVKWSRFQCLIWQELFEDNSRVLFGGVFYHKMRNWK